MKFLAVLFFLSSVSFAESDMHLIYVNGVAEKTVEPNMVLLHLESWAKAATATAAQEQQALQFGKVKSSLDKFKIKKEDIQTHGFSVYPEYTYDQKAQTNKITGYRVSHTVVVTYRKTEDAGTLLDSLVTSKGDSSGINVQSVSWDYDKKAEVESATLGDAVKNARDKADDLAVAAGVTIKAVHKIQHTSYAPPVASPMYERAAMKSMDSVAAPTELSTGQIKVRVEVQMEFEI
ncbi:MAG: SIMPL domain-containing protein [Pseudobdellovibrio sp.]